MATIQNNEAQYIYDILAEEYALLTQITEVQKKVRVCVTTKNWQDLQKNLHDLEEKSVIFQKIEEERCKSFICFTKNNVDDIYKLQKKLQKSYKQTIPELYQQIKRLLISSKIENQAINEYVKITKGFLEGVFDSVLPQRKNVLYTKNGAIVKRQPESIVLNTVL